MPRRNSITVVLLLAAILLTACNGTPTPTTLPLTPTDSPSATPTATPEPPSALTVCLGREPLSLYLYGGSSRAQWSVLEAVYDGPFDRRGYVDQPVILTGLPSLANGDALTSPVTVQRGQMVLDANGNLAPLETGLNVLPSGCSDASCAVAWDGASPLEMNQQRLTYRLIGGLTWSDGTPLTAADSVYSFNLLADPDTPQPKFVPERSQSYEATDDVTVVWTGLPGYKDATYYINFYTPYPEHVWGQFTAAELKEAEVSARLPVGRLPATGVMMTMSL